MTTPAPQLNLTLDELLSTTRSVRKRLDLARPVERGVLEECLNLAQQAPTGSNRQDWHFVLVTDPAKRASLATCYRKGWEYYRSLPNSPANRVWEDPARAATQARISSSSQYLAEHMAEVPVLMVPCIQGRRDGMGIQAQAGMFGSIIPAVWSFMLAARARGLGTCLTTLHLFDEQAAAEALGIPFEETTQVALVPVACTLGTDFKPGPRTPLESIVHWDGW